MTLFLEYDWNKGMLVWDWFNVIISEPRGGFVQFWIASNDWTVTFPREVQP